MKNGADTAEDRGKAEEGHIFICQFAVSLAIGSNPSQIGPPSPSNVPHWPPARYGRPATNIDRRASLVLSTCTTGEASGSAACGCSSLTLLSRQGE